MEQQEIQVKDKLEQDKIDDIKSFEYQGIKVYIKHKKTDRTLVDGLNQFFAQL